MVSRNGIEYMLREVENQTGIIYQIIKKQPESKKTIVAHQFPHGISRELAENGLHQYTHVMHGLMFFE